MLSSLSIKKKGILLVAVPLAFQLMFFCLFLFLYVPTANNLEHLQRVNSLLAGMNSTTVSAVEGLCKAADFETTDVAGQLAAVKDLNSLAKSIDFNSPKAAAYPELKECVEAARSLQVHTKTFLDDVARVVANPRISPQDRTHFYDMNKALALFFEIRDLNNQLMGAEREVLRTMPAEIAKFEAIFQAWIISLCAGSILMAILLGVSVGADTVKRIARIHKNAEALLVDEQVAAPSKGSDEVAQLDQALHRASQSLKEMHRRESAILRHATSIVCSLDTSLRFVTTNSATNAVWGFSEDELRGKSLLTLLSAEQKAGTTRDFTLAKEKKVEIENIIRCADGSLKNFLWVVSWNSDREAYYCVVHDVTKIRAVQKLKREFLSIVSHDLRSPLHSASIAMSLISEGKHGQIPEETLVLVQRIQKNFFNLTRLTNELLELDKLEAGKLGLDLDCRSAYDICYEAKESLAALAKSADVSFEGPSGEALVLADDQKLIQVITNLVANAIKFSPQGSSIKIEIVKMDRYAEIAVSDQGPGIPEDQVDLIFSKFHQVKDQHESKQDGKTKSTGIGLAVVKAITEAHRGQCGVSNLPKGSRFWVQIPLYLEDDDE